MQKRYNKRCNNKLKIVEAAQKAELWGFFPEFQIIQQKILIFISRLVRAVANLSYYP